MLLHQLEGVEIADPLVEGGRPFDVGEQDGDVADREALGTTDHLGAEQALEGLAGQQMLAGEVGVKAQETVVLLGSTLQHRDHGPARGRVRDLEPHRPRSDCGLTGLVGGAAPGQAHDLRLGRGVTVDVQLEAGVDIGADAVDRARCGLELKAGSSTRLQKADRAQHRSARVDIGHAVRPVSLADGTEMEHVVEWLERLRTVVADGAELG